MAPFSSVDSVGLIEPKIIELKNNIKLDSGEEFGPVKICYEEYGTLNKEKNNTVLILHALSGSAHAAGYHNPQDRRAGWWDMMIGPNKAIDTNKYYVLCSNVFGGCYGTTGPLSINPKTGKPFGITFPVISIRDMVKVQKEFIDQLGIPSLLAVCGGSMGGMQVLEWAVNYPDFVKGALPIATTARLSPQCIAFDEVGRRAIMADPKWDNGRYDLKDPPARGLEIARMVGHITYLSEESMHMKFGRRLRGAESYAYDFTTEFEVESYLKYQGERFSKIFDANSYLYITKAMDYFDITKRAGGSMIKIFKDVSANFLIIAFSSDWLFPPVQAKEIAKALRANDKEVSFVEIETKAGHDAFLLEKDNLSPLIKHFLNHLKEKYNE